MLGRIIAIVAPFAITTARIVATDPAMRNFIIDAFGGKVPRTSKAAPVRPHAHSDAFGPCPACKGTGLVAIYTPPATRTGEPDWDYFSKKYQQADPPVSH
jgi:hypothetical protein